MTDDPREESSRSSKQTDRQTYTCNIQTNEEAGNPTKDRHPDIQYQQTNSRQLTPQEEKTTEATLKIAITNVRGLNNDAKREIWFKLWNINRWDVIISTETNSSEQKARH
jgi:hypothetical protein